MYFRPIVRYLCLPLVSFVLGGSLIQCFKDVTILCVDVLKFIADDEWPARTVACCSVVSLGHSLDDTQVL